MSDIFSEVDEDLRRERAEKLWKAYGKYVIVAAAVVVAGTAGYVAWRDYSQKQAEAGAIQYLATIDQAASGDMVAADRALAALSRTAPAGYAVMARFQEAALKSRNGDAAGAVSLYRGVANDNSVDRELRDAATVLSALNGVEAGDGAEIERAASALATPLGAWRHIAWEVQGMLALKDGRLAEARDRYRQISDDADAPSGLRARAAEMLAALPG